MHIPLLQLQKKTCLMQRAREFGHGVVVSKICYNAVIVLSVVQCDCCKPMSNCGDWAFSNSGLDVGLPAFLLPMFATCDALPKDFSTCFLKESIPAIPFGNTNHIPYQKLEVPESRSTFQQLCLMLASCTSLCCSCSKKPVSCREAEGLVTELWSPKFVTLQWLCSPLCHVTAANRWTIAEIELLATVGWNWGCQPFSWRCSQNVTQCQTWFVGHVCFRNLFLPFLFGIPSIHSLPEAWGSWERQYAPPALHYGCIMLARDPIPFSKIPDLCLIQRSRRSGQCCGLQGLLWKIGMCFFSVCHVDYCNVSRFCF